MAVLDSIARQPEGRGGAGQSSIAHVNPADAGRKPRTYAVFIDEPIAL